MRIGIYCILKTFFFIHFFLLRFSSTFYAVHMPCVEHVYMTFDSKLEQEIEELNKKTTTHSAYDDRLVVNEPFAVQ